MSKELLDYVVATSGRTGSNLLQRLLKNNGLNDPHEWFHPTLFGFQEAAKGGMTCEQWLVQMRRENSIDGVFGTKLMASHPKQMMPHMAGGVGDESSLVESLFGEARFIYLWRDDVERQALSFWRAQTSGKWAKWRDEPPAERSDPPALDMKAIEFHVRSINTYNAFWREFFERTAIEPYRISYEALDADRRTAILDIAEFLGRPIAGEPNLEIDIVRQADEQTERYLEQIRGARRSGAAKVAVE